MKSKRFGGNKHEGYGNPVYSGNEWKPDPEFKRLKRSVWKIPTASYKEAHFAVYPEKLIETPILAGCPKDGIVLDPFFGSGTTGLVSWKHQRNFIGIEINQNYCFMAQKRIGPITKIYIPKMENLLGVGVVMDYFLPKDTIYLTDTTSSSTSETH